MESRNKDNNKIKIIETRKPESSAQRRRKEFARFLVKSAAAGLFAIGVTLGVANIDTCVRRENKLDIRYETAKDLPVKKGNDIPLCADGPTGTACYARITDINEKGIELRFFSEVFMSEATTQTIKLDYGRGATFNAGTRLDAITAKRGDKPGEAKITVTSIPRSKTE